MVSKAQRYKDAVNAAPSYEGTHFIARVSLYGDLLIEDADEPISASEAIVLAQWIIETFSSSLVIAERRNVLDEPLVLSSHSDAVDNPTSLLGVFPGNILGTGGY